MSLWAPSWECSCLLAKHDAVKGWRGALLVRAEKLTEVLFRGECFVEYPLISSLNSWKAAGEWRGYDPSAAGTPLPQYAAPAFQALPGTVLFLSLITSNTLPAGEQIGQAPGFSHGAQGCTLTYGIHGPGLGRTQTCNSGKVLPTHCTTSASHVKWSRFNHHCMSPRAGSLVLGTTQMNSDNLAQYSVSSFSVVFRLLISSAYSSPSLCSTLWVPSSSGK